MCLRFLKFLVLISDTINIDRLNLHKQKLSGSLSDFLKLILLKYS